MSLHVEPPQGLRIEDSEQYFARVEKEIRAQIPQDRISLILDNIGLPNSGINLAFGNSSTLSDTDGDIQIALKPGGKDTQKYMRLLRADLKQKFPGRHVLLHAGEHHEPDSGLRPACADRSAGDWA